jgi:hypothetical protein
LAYLSVSHRSTNGVFSLIAELTSSNKWHFGRHDGHIENVTF